MTFCPNCGRPLQDGEVCNCTAPQAQPEKAAGVAAVTDKVTGFIDKGIDFIKKNSKLALIGAGILAVILIAIIVLTSLGGGSYKEPFDDTCKILNKGEKADVLDLELIGMSDKAVDVMNALAKTGAYSDYMEEAQDELKDNFEELSDEYSKWKLSFEYDKAEKMDKDDIEDYYDDLEDMWDAGLEDALDGMRDTLDDDDELEAFCDMFDCSEGEAKDIIKKFIKLYESMDPDKVDIDGGYTVKGRYVLKDGSKEINKTDKVTAYVLKINGDWVIFSTKDGARFRFDREEDDYELYSFMETYMNSKFSDSFNLF